MQIERTNEIKRTFTSDVVISVRSLRNSMEEANLPNHSNSIMNAGGCIPAQDLVLPPPRLLCTSRVFNKQSNINRHAKVVSPGLEERKRKPRMHTKNTIYSVGHRSVLCSVRGRTVAQLTLSNATWRRVCSFTRVTRMPK